jgi:O-antigen/teichoic acid export membrane protein
VLFGTEYTRAGELLLLVCAFATITAIFASPPSIAVLWALDKQPLMLRVRIVAAAVNIGLAVPLIEWRGALGAVIATGIAAFLTAVAEFELARRHAAVRIEIGFTVTTLAAGAAAGLAGFALVGFGTAGLVAALVVSPAVFLGALAIVRPLRDEDLDVLGRIDPRLSRVLERFTRRSGA